MWSRYLEKFSQPPLAAGKQPCASTGSPISAFSCACNRPAGSWCSIRLVRNPKELLVVGVACLSVRELL